MTLGMRGAWPSTPAGGWCACVRSSRCARRRLAERARLASIDSEGAALSARIAELRSALAQEQRRLVAHEAAAERVAADIARLAREHKSLAEEIAQVASRCEAIDREQEALRERA